MPLKSTVSLPGAPASGIFPNDTHSPTRVGSAPIFPVALIPPGTSPIPRPVESREKRKPRVRPRAHRYQKSTLNKKGKVERLRWSRRSADFHIARIPQFFCDNCDADFVQKQGLNRHREHKHRDEYDEPSLCIRCDFKCTRPYEYRAHLEKRHPEVDANLILGKVAGSRRRTAYFARYPSQQVLLPTIDHGRWGDSGIRRYPPTVVKPSIPALPLPDITHVLELESTHLIMMDNVISEGAVNCIILCHLFSSPFPIRRRACTDDLDGSSRCSSGGIHARLSP